MKRMIRGLLGMAMIWATALQLRAQGTLMYDQQSATGPLSPFGNDFFDIQTQPLTQSFIPSLSAIGFVQFEFADFSGNGNNGATVYVNLWIGSPNVNSATLLGSTAPVYMPNGFGFPSAGVTDFYFSTPISLVFGQTYYLQPVVLSGDNPWDIMVLTNMYPKGSLYGSGLPEQPGSDLWFREGVVVPEPATLALLGLGGFFALLCKHRPSQPVPLFTPACIRREGGPNRLTP